MVSFSASEMNHYSQELKFTLIGKFSYGYLALHIIKKEFFKLNLTREYFVGILNMRHILIKLSNEQDYLKICRRGMLWMDKFPMRILKWTMDFNRTVESLIVPVWVRFPNLPYCLFHKAALTKIASMIGKPLKLDHETKAQSRPTFARICVKMDILVERPKTIFIEMRNICIE